MARRAMSSDSRRSADTVEMYPPPPIRQESERAIRLPATDILKSRRLINRPVIRSNLDAAFLELSSCAFDASGGAGDGGG